VAYIVVLSIAFAIVCIPLMGDPQAERAVSDDRAQVVSTIPPGVIISEFYPHAVCDDEYFVLTNTGSSSVSVEGWEVTDGEGVVVFVDPMYVRPYASLVVSFNESSYLAAYGTLPDVYIDGLSTDSGVQVSGTFRLGTDGDSLSLRQRPDQGLRGDALLGGVDLPVHRGCHNPRDFRNAEALHDPEHMTCLNC